MIGMPEPYVVQKVGLPMGHEEKRERSQPTQLNDGEGNGTVQGRMGISAKGKKIQKT